MRVINVDGKKFKRTVHLEKMTAFTKSLDDAHFLLHQENMHDYEFNSQQREEFLQHLKVCYYNLTKENLPVFGVKDGLDKYRTPKKSKVLNLRGSNVSGILPPNENRLFDEDVFDKASVETGSKNQLTYEESTGLTVEESKESLVNQPFCDTRQSATNESLQSMRYRSLASQFVRKQKKILVNRYEWIKAVGEGAFG